MKPALGQVQIGILLQHRSRKTFRIDYIWQLPYNETPFSDESVGNYFGSDLTVPLLDICVCDVEGYPVVWPRSLLIFPNRTDFRLKECLRRSGRVPSRH